jgi:hypothetical protein
LLKNTENILPLDYESIQSIAVFGDQASIAPIYSGGGSGSVKTKDVVTPLQGIT